MSIFDDAIVNLAASIAGTINHGEQSGWGLSNDIPADVYDFGTKMHLGFMLAEAVGAGREEFLELTPLEIARKAYDGVVEQLTAYPADYELVGICDIEHTTNMKILKGLVDGYAAGARS